MLRRPGSALLGERGVLVLVDSELVEREITLGLRNWKYAEVQAGLELGELVVSALDRVEIEAGARAIEMREDKRGRR